MIKQTQYNWNDPDDGMKAEKRIYPSARPHNFWDSPEQLTKATVSMKAEKGIYHRGSLEIDWGNPGDTVKLKDDMKFGKRANPAKKLFIRVKCSKEEKSFPWEAKFKLTPKNHKITKIQ